MADDADVEAAKSGDKDLARRDLRKADLSQVDLRETDLSGAHLEHSVLRGANLAGATLGGAHLMKADMSGANLHGVIAPSTVFFGMSLEGADLREANLSSSNFTRTNLRGADLRGAKFLHAVLSDGTDFTDAIVDQTTEFDGAKIIRPLASQDAFRFYHVSRGILHRRDPNEIAVTPTLQPEQAATPNRFEDVERRIAELLEALAPLSPPAIVADRSASIGHNNPPEPTPLERPEFEELGDTLTTIAVELRHDEIRREVIIRGAATVEHASQKVAAWVARKADLAIDECSKQFGKSLGDARLWMAGWLVISGKLVALAEILSAIRF